MPSEEEDFLTEEFFQNPYEFYRRMSLKGPITWSQKKLGWLVSDHNLCQYALRDDKFSSLRTSVDKIGLPSEVSDAATELSSFYADWLMFNSGEKHQVLRRVVTNSLSREFIALSEVSVRETIHEFTTKLPRGREFDVIHDFIYPTSVAVFLRLFGIPSSYSDVITGWSKDIVAFLGGSKNITLLKEASLSSRKLTNLIEQLIDDSNEDDSSLINRLVNNGTDVLSKRELVGIVSNMVVDGFEPIAHAFGSGIYHLLITPWKYERLVEDPSRIETAVEEILRFESPFQYASRVSTESEAMKVKDLKAGDKVLFLLGAANRDPKVFENPETFSIERIENPHLSFGYGPHFCVGASIARLILRVSFLEFVTMNPEVRLVEKNPQWIESLGYRGLRSLKIEILN